MQETGKNAVEYFSNGFLCSEAVLKAVAEEKKVDSEFIPKIATAFGRGLADSESICGALSGGILALSMFQGRINTNESFETLYANIAQLQKAFKDEFKETECPKLLGFSLNDTDAKEKFVKNDCKACKCSRYVEFVTNKVANMLH